MGDSAKSTSRVYFQAFRLYEVPLSPHPADVISFAQTQGRDGYFVGYLDANERLERVEKIELVTQDHCVVQLDSPREPGARVFYHVKQDETLPVADRVCGEVDYAETEDDHLFFEGRVVESGMQADVALVERRVAFADSYGYWENGQLMTRVQERGDKQRKWRYNEDGEEITSAIPELLPQKEVQLARRTPGTTESGLAHVAIRRLAAHFASEADWRLLLHRELAAELSPEVTSPIVNPGSIRVAFASIRYVVQAYAKRQESSPMTDEELDQLLTKYGIQDDAQIISVSSKSPRGSQVVLAFACVPSLTPGVVLIGADPVDTSDTWLRFWSQRKTSSTKSYERRLFRVRRLEDISNALVDVEKTLVDFEKM